ncbi:phosphotransferase enzyme family protein [Halobacillus sp. A5]|uniref:phosphotransferase enzyme family protein n=1 Tax=Halobacillus sp. A5 TaxID=2880263 RepID=UPI0020A6C733|nr:phosphotransferase [Halobacillus sp. A5]MCP3027252.1 phosphotransferase [Halobacillus sp. A5]
MELEVDRIFTDEVLDDAAHRFNVKMIKKVGSFENYVYEVMHKGKPMILRITHSSHRKKQEIEAEVEWVNDLYVKGIPASLCKRSAAGHFVEEIPAEKSAFYVCLFHKAPGKRAQIKSGDTTLFKRWGSITGQMHNAVITYNPKNRRKRWDEDELLDFQLYLDLQKDREIIEAGQRLKQQIGSLPENKETFGLIHADLHQGNFFLEGDIIHPFDFDDSCYFYFAHDLAVPVYYSMWSNGNLRNEEMEELFISFLEGYSSKHSLTQDILRTVPLFLKLRDYTLYSVLHKKWEIPALKRDEKQLLQGIRERLVKQRPIADLSYDRIWSSC